MAILYTTLFYFIAYIPRGDEEIYLHKKIILPFKNELLKNANIPYSILDIISFPNNSTNFLKETEAPIRAEVE